METNRSWSIDDKRYNFQFGCEIGWEIRDGKRVRMLKNPSYSGITTEFWNCLRRHRRPRALDALGRAELRQGTARAGDGHGPRREPVAFRQHQNRRRLCGMRLDRAVPRVLDLAADEARRARRQRSRSDRRRADRRAHALRQQHDPSECRGDATQRSRCGRRSTTHGARHHQPSRRAIRSAARSGSDRDDARRRSPMTGCCRLPSPTGR